MSLVRMRQTCHFIAASFEINRREHLLVVVGCDRASRTGIANAVPVQRCRRELDSRAGVRKCAVGTCEELLDVPRLAQDNRSAENISVQSVVLSWLSGLCSQQCNSSGTWLDKMDALLFRA